MIKDNDKNWGIITNIITITIHPLRNLGKKFHPSRKIKFLKQIYTISSKTPNKMISTITEKNILFSFSQEACWTPDSLPIKNKLFLLAKWLQDKDVTFFLKATSSDDKCPKHFFSKHGKVITLSETKSIRILTTLRT